MCTVASPAKLVPVLCVQEDEDEAVRLCMRFLRSAMKMTKACFEVRWPEGMSEAEMAAAGDADKFKNTYVTRANLKKAGWQPPQQNPQQPRRRRKRGGK